MSKNLFTIYTALEPPPVKPITYNFYKSSLQTPYINPYMINPQTNTNTYEEITSENINPFEFQPEKPKFTQKINKPSTLQNDIVNLARNFIGSKYVWGGKTPSTGFDCSGLISYVYKQNGINIPSSTAGLFKTGQKVSLENIQVGDIICMKGSGSTGRHVKMVSQINPNGQIFTIEAKNKKYGVVEELFDLKPSQIISIRRVTINNQNNNQNITNKNQFIQVLNSNYKNALLQRGLNPNYSTILVAQDAYESGWGKSVKGNYNYGNITTNGTDWHIKTGNRKWKDFNSIEDYVNYKIDYLSRDRYNFFNTFKPTSNIAIAMQTVANQGYDSTNKNYGKQVERVYNSIIREL